MNKYVTVTNGAAFGLAETFDVLHSSGLIASQSDTDYLAPVIGCRTAHGKSVHIRCCGSIAPGATLTAVRWVTAKNWLRNNTDWLCRNCSHEERFTLALLLLEIYINDAEQDGLIK